MAADEEKLNKFVGRKGSPYHEARKRIADKTRKDMSPAKSKALKAKMGKKGKTPKVYRHEWMGEMKFDEEGNRQH